jgi:hypothetical protein
MSESTRNGWDDARPTAVSLYFDTKHGRRLELEEAAEIAVAWGSALRQTLREVQPGVELRIELVDGDDGSLWLNTLLRLAESALETISRGADAYPRLKAIAKGLAIIVVATPIQWTADQVWEAIISDEPEIARLSPAAQQQILDTFSEALNEGTASAEKRRLARRVAGTGAIKRIGIAPAPYREPHVMVSADEMREFASREEVQIESTRRRVVEMEVILVSPVLEGKERSWKFREFGMPEFGAVMKDHDFLDAIARGALHQEFRFGIEMVIEVEVKEVLENDVWVPAERSVLRVIRPYVGREDLFAPSR